MSSRIRHGLTGWVLCIALLVLGCGAGEDETSRVSTDPIVNGDPVGAGASQSGVIMFFLPQCGGEFGGSGFLLTNEWIITARHVVDGCIQTTPGTIAVMGGSDDQGNPIPGTQQRNVVQVIPYPTTQAQLTWVDVALLRVDQPFDMPDRDGDGSLSTGFRARIHEGDAVSLRGQQCTAFGYGPRSAFCTNGPDGECDINTPGAGGTVLRSAPLQITALANDFFTSHPLSQIMFGALPRFLGGNRFQHTWPGDSGGPCMLNGEVIAGLASTVDPPTGRMGFLAANGFRDWVRQIVFESESRDFDGDDRPDVVLRSSVDGTNPILLMQTPGGLPNAAAQASLFTSPDLDWQIVGAGDFDEDNKVDVLWQNSTTGDVALWLLEGAVDGNGQVPIKPNGNLPITRIADLNWRIVAVADINVDQRSDIIWQHDTAHNVCFWLLEKVTSGTPVFQTGCVTSDQNPDWRVVGATDFDRFEISAGNLIQRGQADILWRNVQTGETRVWAMDFVPPNYALRREVALFPEPVDRTVGVVADYDRDGREDVLWRAVDGTLGLWLGDVNLDQFASPVEIAIPCGTGLTACVNDAIPATLQIVAP